MRKLVKKFTRAQSAVEFAVALPALITLLLVAGDYGRVFYYALEVGDAARAGAQYGAQSLTKAVDTSGIQNAAQNDAANISISVPASSITTYCTCSNLSGHQACSPEPSGCGTFKTYLDVTATATFTTVSQWPMLPHSIPLTSTAELEVQ